jgi:hypothetical protein
MAESYSRALLETKAAILLIPKSVRVLANHNRPAYLPDALSMHISEAGIEEPMWIHLSFMRRAQREGWFTEHPIGVREITRLTLTTPMPLRSNASQKIIESGVLATRTGATSLLEIELDGHRRKDRVDFRPHLPVIFQL